MSLDGKPVQCMNSEPRKRVVIEPGDRLVLPSAIGPN